MLWWFAQTTLIAGALAVVATLAGRWKRLGPEARHALWLLVLIKLATPPIVAWPWALPDAWPARVEVAVEAPAPVPFPSPMAEPVAVAIEPSESLPTPTPDPLPVVGPPPSPDEVLAGAEIPEEVPVATTPAPRPIEISVPAPAPRVQESEISNRKSQLWDLRSWIGDWDKALLAAWLAGSVVVVARRGFKVFRFHRGLAHSRPAPDWLVDEARAIGDRVGVRPPPVLATPRVATPLLWCLGRPRLILPEALIKRLGVDRWPGILAHELAHLARGDQWVVRLELLVEAAWWWNPLFWLARRRLHEEAEIACDARVVRALPERRYAYAEALVDVCEHIARSAIPSPSLGVGGSDAARTLEGRLHMILKGPISRRPNRRAALLAALLAALALPAWTLGQQPEPPKPKPDAPASKPDAPAPVPFKEQTPDAPSPKPAPTPEPEAPRPVILAPNQELESIEAIRAGQKGKLQKHGQLSFRLAVVGREQSHNDAFAYAGNGTKANAVGPTVIRRKAVHVQAADVVLGPLGRSRADVLEARPMPDGPADPAGPPRPPVAWARRLVALDDEGYTALETAWDRSGPVPFRWLGGRGHQAFGDSLTSAFFRPNNGVQPFHSSDLDRQFEPLDPRPRNALELYGVPTFLKAEITRVEVLGFDKVDGRDAVRIAWSATADIGLRGLCWVAPELDYAVVLLNATQDPAPGVSRAARRSWRRRSSDFEKVADHLWLPRKVTIEEALLDPAGGEPTLRREREMTFENYRVDPTVPADTFRPKLAIQTLDDASGNFTAQPPEVPAGLVDRLAKAVRESKFGPPMTERVVEVTRPAAEAGEKPGNQQGQAPGAPQSARPPLNFEDPIPRVDPKTDDPTSARNLPDRAEIDRAVDRRLALDPEVAAMVKELKAASSKVADTKRMVADINDPGLRATQRKLDTLKAKYQQLREDRSAEILKELGLDPARARDEAEVLQARRDGKLAEVRKAEARRDLAKGVVDRNKGPAGPLVDVAQAETDLKIAEAEVESKKAELAEADAHLNQARRRTGLASAARPAPDPLARKATRPPIAEEPKDDVAPDARDEVALRQARRDARAAELQKAEARLEMARLDNERASNLQARKAIGQQEFEQSVTGLKVAEADIASKKAELAEADVLLSQAKRGFLGRSTASPGASSPGDRPSTLAELRDAVEVMEVQIQGKQAEMRRAEALASLTRIEAANTRRLTDKRGVSMTEAELADDKARADQAALEAKKAEVLEFEVRLKHAKRRLEAGEARLKRDVERAKARLEWAENMFKKGYVPKATYEADKATYDELMIQLDPNYTPAPAAAPEDEPGQPPAKPQSSRRASPVPPSDDVPSQPTPKPQAMRREPLDDLAFPIGALW